MYKTNRKRNLRFRNDESTNKEPVKIWNSRSNFEFSDIYSSVIGDRAVGDYVC